MTGVERGNSAQSIGCAQGSPGLTRNTGCNFSKRIDRRGDEITVQAGPEGIRFLLVSGKPIEEPVAWYGPIVMNTQEQLRQAIADLQDGTFIAGRSPKES